MVKLTDRPDMTIDVYRGRKTTTQQQQHIKSELFKIQMECYVINILRNHEMTMDDRCSEVLFAMSYFCNHHKAKTSDSKIFEKYGMSG